MKTRSSADKSSEVKKSSTAQAPRHPAGASAAMSPHETIMSLQRTRGNRAVQRFYETGQLPSLQRQAPVEEEQPVCTIALQPRPREEEEELKTKSVLQPKLTVSSPDDAHEREAEQVAEEVSTFAKTSPGGPQSSLLYQLNVLRVMGLTGTAGRSFQSTTWGGRKLRIFANTAERETEPGTISPGIESRIMQSRGTGRPLPGHVHTAMSLRTGYDFSAVRIKTDAEAAELSRSINARAFTVGSDIWLGRNESPDDVHLMSHELTHVVQQGAAARISPASVPGSDRIRESSAVVKHLQGLTNGTSHDPSQYRTEIERFEQSNPPDRIAELHRQILEKPQGGEIGRSSDSKVMRDCGCNGGPSGGGGTPVPSYASGTTLGVKPGNTEGWIRGRLGNSATSPEHSFYEYQKVSYDRRDGGRDYFDILEGPYSGQKGSLLPGYLDNSCTWSGGAAITFREDGSRSTPLQSRGTLDYNIGSVGAKIFVNSGTSKIAPDRNYNLALPDAPHAGGSRYGDYAKIWFHIEGGPQGDEYLHRGDRSAGCVSVQGNWPGIFGYLKNKRADNRHVGTIRRVVV